MDKLLLFPGKTDKGIFTYVIDAEKAYLEKTAAEYHPTIAAYINGAKPIKGRTQILLTALGAGEWWGDNVNGDYFPETALAHEGADYGYKTFESLAKVYKHHVNKDPMASYGDVVLSVYNPVFHRVELIVSLDNAKAPDIAQRIDNGEYPDVSMGCKVPYDICSICGNRAPTRMQYCDHLRYNMGRIDRETGKKAYAINTHPKFFDISFVLIGADRIAKTLRKVASYNTIPTLSSAYLAEKMAERQKAAEIKKEIPPNQPPASLDKAVELARSVMEVKSMEPALPKDTLNSLAKQPIGKVMSTMLIMGILPKPQEFQRIFLISTGHGPLADKLDRENVCFDPQSAEDAPESSYPKVDLGAHNFDESIMERLSPFMEDRSYFPGHLGKRIVIMIKRGQEQPQPKYMKIPKEEFRKPLIGPVGAIAAAAGAFYALIQAAPKETLTGMNKVLSSKMGLALAAATGLGIMKIFNTVTGPKQVGQFSPENSVSNPDANDVFARIEQYKAKPFTKVSGVVLPFKDRMGAASRRLLGIPAVYLASGMLNKQRELSPYEEEGWLKRTIRRYPDYLSAALLADAYLAGRGHFSTHSAIRPLFNLASKGKEQLGKLFQMPPPESAFAKAAALANEVCGYELIKTADAQEFLSNSVVWPLAMGKANLPGRIVGGLFDQAVIEAGSKLLEKRRKAKEQGTAK